MATNENTNLQNVYKVKLHSYLGEMVIFDVSPELSESRTVNYSTIEPIHAPGAIFAYKNTSSRTFQLSNIKFISRTQIEADKNLSRLWMLRSWCTPRFGHSSLSEKNKALREAGHQDSTFEVPVYDNSEYGIELLGTPPPVIYLTAYSQNSKLGTRQHINRVPTLIQTFNINYPTDVDYIPTTTGVPMPTIMTLDLSLVETHSPREYENFSLGAFKRGILRNY